MSNGTEPAREISAQRFVLTDQDGQPRAVLGAVSDEGAFGLTLIDRTGRERAWFALDAEIAELALGLAGNVGVSLRTVEGEASAFDLCDLDGVPVESWRV